MAERRWPTREDLQELRKQGVVFSSPLSVRTLCLAALFGAALFCRSWVPSDVVPAGFADLSAYARSVGTVGVALSVVCVAVSLLVTLISNGFVLSVDLLASRSRLRGNSGLGVGIVSVALGACCGYALICEFAGDLFLLLRVGGQEGLRSALAALGVGLSAAVILGAFAVAMLVIGVARVRFLFVNRVSPGSREQ